MSEEPGAESFHRAFKHSIRVVVPAFLLTVGMVAADTLSPLADRPPPDKTLSPLVVWFLPGGCGSGCLKRIPPSVKNMS